MYLSFVSVGRNDNYGGDFDFRLQNSVRFIAHYVEKYKIPSEYIFVNYNPFYDKPSLQESLDWPKDRKYLKIRIIDVPPEVHKEVADPNIRKPVPVLEYIAKNVGIRRAKGEYVLATNPDIIFNPKILKYIAKRRLRKDTFYRTDRCDFTKIPEEIVNGSPRSYVRHIRKKTFNIALKGNRYDVKPGTGLGWQLFKKRIYNYFRIKYDLALVKYEEKAMKYKLNIDYDNAEYFYHCNVSGDFMLLHRDKWFELHGNPENTYVAVHTDALMVIIAGTYGLKEKVFNAPIYHQDHDRRFDCDDIDVDPMLYDAYHTFQSKAQGMLKNNKAVIYNGDNWGMPEKDFQEVVF